MAFSLKDVKLKEDKKSNENIKACFALIKQIPCLTKSIQSTLIDYLKQRSKTRGISYLTVDEFKEMIIDLLETCTGVRYENITIDDIQYSEIDIIRNIQEAIATKSIYHLYSDYI